MNLRRGLMIAALLCLAPGLALAEDIRKEFHESFEAVPGTVLELHSGDGDVTLTTWDRDRIQVDIVYHASITKIGLGPKPGFDVKVHSSPDRLVIKGDEKGGTAFGFYSRNRSLYTWSVQAPAGIALELHGDDGDVRITGWRADLDLNLDDGDIHLSGIRGRSLVLTLDDGDVDGRDIASALSITTDDGDIRLEDLASPDLELATDDGDVTLRFGGPGPHRLVVTSDDGDVRLQLRPPISLAWDIETDDGRIDLDLGEGDGHQQRANGGRLSGAAGGGAGFLEIRTDDGDVEVTVE